MPATLSKLVKKDGIWKLQPFPSMEMNRIRQRPLELKAVLGFEIDRNDVMWILDRGAPLVVAHRGGAGLAPENTLAACRRALALGVDAVEIDVRLSRDGVVVVMHDATLDRTTTGQGRVADHTAAEMARLDATRGARRWRGPAEPPPTLGTVLALLHGRAAAHVELKGDPRVAPALVQAVLAAIAARAPRPAPVLLSFDWAALATVPARAPGLATMALAAAWPADGPATLHRLAEQGVSWVGLRYDAVTAARVAAVHAVGLRLGVWTVNHRASLRRALALQLDAITTDHPDRLLGLLASSTAAGYR